jgi:type I restriction enzyme, R subunit
MTPEARACQDIDRLLSLAGWHICNIFDANIHAAGGVAICELPLLAAMALSTTGYTSTEKL